MCNLLDEDFARSAVAEAYDVHTLLRSVEALPVYAVVSNRSFVAGGSDVGHARMYRIGLNFCFAGVDYFLGL